MRGKLIVISGPSAVGKDSIVKEYLKSNNNAILSISATSRPIRKGEIDGVDYYFLTKEEFENQINKGYFLEHFIYNDNYYGTPKNKIDEILDKGLDVILIIEVQGAMYVKDIVNDAITIFIMPPSIEELNNRIRKRNIDTEEEIEKRMEIAKKEIIESSKYDYIVVNNDIEETKERIEKIIIGEKSE